MLTELYPPFIGGSEEYVRNLAIGLTARGHEVSVATIAAANEPSTTDEDGVRVHRLASTTGRLAAFMPSGRPYHPPAPDPEVVAALRGLVAETRPDVVHAHNWMVNSFLPLRSASGAALVMTLHDYQLVCSKRSLLYRGRECSGPGFSKCLHCAAGNYGTARGELITLANWATVPVLRNAVDMFVPVSHAVAERSGLAGSDESYTVIPNFVPNNVALEVDDEHPALAQLPAGRFCLYVGALTAHKGIGVLLEAYAGLVGAPPLVVIGRSAAEGMPHMPAGVICLTDLPHSAVMAAWRRATVGVIPSLFPDPCPTVALEAMAAGVPVVGSRNGGLPELVVDGETGLLVSPGDAVALRQALSRLLGNDGERLDMARAAAQRAPDFMAARVVPRLEQVYWQVRP